MVQRHVENLSCLEDPWSLDEAMMAVSGMSFAIIGTWLYALTRPIFEKTVMSFKTAVKLGMIFASITTFTLVGASHN